MSANARVAVPANLPPVARETSPDHPWPLRLLNAKIAEYISKMSRLWVEGEIITLTRRKGAKVQFFTLSDLEEKASITCKIFAHALPDGIESGSRVIVCAKPDFWSGNGTLALHVDEIRAVGLGDILARIEALKNKLAYEGLFAPQRKKPLPFLPRTIGLIVGRNTKALHDVQVNACPLGLSRICRARSGSSRPNCRARNDPGTRRTRCVAERGRYRDRPRRRIG